MFEIKSPLILFVRPFHSTHHIPNLSQQMHALCVEPCVRSLYHHHHHQGQRSSCVFDMLRSVRALFQTTPPSYTGGTSVNLVRAAQHLIQLLDRVHQFPCLYTNTSVLEHALFRYEFVWLPLLAATPPAQRTLLVPPLDVHWVWLCHMLCPARYATDAPAMAAAAAAMGVNMSGNGTLSNIDHCLLSPADYRRGVRLTQRLWAQHDDTDPYDLTDSLSLTAFVVTKGKQFTPTLSSRRAKCVSNISYDVIAASSRQMAFHYQVAILPHYRHDSYIEVAVGRYNKFLQLMRDFPGQTWIPTYDMDLIWHAHMLHPRHYANDTKRMCGRLITHDDSINDRADGASRYTRFWNHTCSAWRKQFGEAVLIPGAVWRGDLAIEELQLQTHAKRLVLGIGESLHCRQHRRSGVLPNRGRIILSFKLRATTGALDATAQRRWDTVPWVHAQGYRQATSAVCSGGGGGAGADSSAGSSSEHDVHNEHKHEHDALRGPTAKGAVERWSVAHDATAHDANDDDTVLSCRVVLPRTCFHRKAEACATCGFVEVFAPRRGVGAAYTRGEEEHDDDGNHGSGGAAWLPVCSAQLVGHLAVCLGDAVRRGVCTRVSDERMVLLRMCGDDFALLGGRWTYASHQPRDGGDRGSWRALRGTSARTRGGAGGKRMVLRLWPLRAGTADRWTEASGGTGRDDGLSYRLALGDERDGWHVQFDLRTAVVTVVAKSDERRRGMGSLVVCGHGIAAAAALLLAELRGSEPRGGDGDDGDVGDVGGGEMVALVGGDVLTARRVETC